VKAIRRAAAPLCTSRSAKRADVLLFDLA